MLLHVCLFLLLTQQKGNSALIMAAQHGHDRVVDTLLLHYLNINMPGAVGCGTIIHAYNHMCSDMLLNFACV